MKKLMIVVCLFIYFILLSSETFSSFYNDRFNEYVRYVIGDKVFSTYEYESYRFAVIYSDNGLKFFINSDDFAQVIGFQGTTTLGIVFSTDLTIETVQILSSQETMSFVRRIERSDFLSRLRGFAPYKCVEVITGATMTCEAIMETLSICIETFIPIAKKYLEYISN
jgi:hypothetical protein